MVEQCPYLIGFRTFRPKITDCIGKECGRYNECHGIITITETIKVRRVWLKRKHRVRRLRR